MYLEQSACLLKLVAVHMSMSGVQEMEWLSLNCILVGCVVIWWLVDGP
jgi:hypothetical protein